MKRIRAGRGMAVAAAAATALVGIVLTTPSVASAGPTPTYWVNNAVSAVGGNGTSCSAPGYTTIQAAINVAESSATGIIDVCPGTYPEQLQVTAPNTFLTIQPASPGGGVTVEVPSTPSDSTSLCDTAP